MLLQQYFMIQVLFTSSLHYQYHQLRGKKTQKTFVYHFSALKAAFVSVSLSELHRLLSCISVTEPCQKFKYDPF